MNDLRPSFTFLLLAFALLFTGSAHALQIANTATAQMSGLQAGDRVSTAATQLAQQSDETGNQQATGWNNRAAAVILTYDDALNVHLDNVVPVLDENGLQGTFYVTINVPGFTDRVDDWQRITENGHELANHTLFHPCIGQGRSFVEDDYNLSTYSVDRIIDELVVTNQILDLMDGKPETRTFAYPCGNQTAGGESYVEALQPHFIAARAVQGRIETLEDVDLYDVGTYMISGHSADDMIRIVENAIEANGLITFLFHGVGGEHNIDVDLDEHNALISWLKENEDRVWVTTMAEAAQYINNSR